MSKPNSLRSALLSVATVATTLLVAGIVVSAEPSPEAARLDSFSHADGTNYFALSLNPNVNVPAAEAHDIVVLFDTSASQTGQFREEALDALQALLAKLGPKDRVRLVAVDLDAVPLSDTFVAPDSDEMVKALEKLNARVPLGSTDMRKALWAAADSYGPNATNSRAAVYIGDGMSTAKVLGTEQFGNLVDKLVDGRVPVSSYVVGPRLDEQLLGALAGKTGGRMIGPSADVSGARAGNDLAAAARAAVLWPTATTWPAGLAEVFPKRMPPLRTDRDTAVIGTYKGQGPFQIQTTADTTGGAKNLTWSVKPSKSDEDFNTLAQLVEAARIDGGLSLPIIGAASLRQARVVADVGVRNIVKLAREALAGGNPAGAEQLADEALRRDPGNPEALALKGAVAKRQAGAGGGAAGAADLNLVGPGAGQPAPGAAADPFGAEGAFAEAFQHDRKVVSQMITADVQHTVNQARGKMSTNPEGAIQDLKLQLESVRRAPELDPDVRDQLVDQIQAALREGSRRQVAVEQRRQEQHETLAAAKERMLINENLLRDQQKLRQLMERFNSLMDEGRYRFAEEAAAKEAQKLAPDSSIPLAATLTSRTRGYLTDALAVRVARQKAVVDTLYQVEKSHMPFPDEPPIVYPDAEVWQRLTARRQEKYKSMDLAARGAAEKKITEELHSPTTLEFIETPLADVVDYLKDLHDIEIQVDNKALEDVGVGSDTPITRDLKGISLRSALRLMLRDLDLTYVIQDEVLLITTPEEAESRLATKVYPVADLVLPIESTGMMGGFGGMGGMGGGMGGMGGGGGGGGMGGGGMGGGGMGGGMGGGGMFNVPQGVLPPVPPGGFRAFAVKDDLNVSPKRNLPDAKVDKSAASANRPKKIEVEIEEGADPNAVWEKYLSANQPEPAAVRDAVRRLMKDKQYDHVIALIQAALRHRQVQSWMYEAMSLAMQADGRSKREIERAVMSAVDFADNTADLMYVGTYLAHLGLDHRALDIFRQVARLEPVRPEPYLHGLKAARRLGDLEGIKWAVMGIVGQAWPSSQNEVWKAGLRTARATLAKLRAGKHAKQANQFQAALDEAIIRDCVVRVSWTGDADVDLLVEEPSGTICSLRNPRTTAGGVMLGDGSSHTAGNTSEGYSEIYVCPKAFSGTYRMLLRRVWGKVTAGKVTVRIDTHFRTKEGKTLIKKVSLVDDEAVVVFDLDQGRRKESLKQHQVANAAVGQLAVRRQVLGQQLAAAVDPRTMLHLAQSRQSAGNNSGMNSAGFFPFAGGGAVGYQPVIITLPEGANMMATAVISADRRYVRVTCLPMFSGVSEVNVFNMVTGENTEGQGGTGGQGWSGLFGSGGGGGGGGGMGF